MGQERAVGEHHLRRLIGIGALAFLTACSHGRREKPPPQPDLSSAVRAFSAEASRVLLPGLAATQNVLTWPEFDLMRALEARGLRVVYLNKYGEVRYDKDASLITEQYEAFQKKSDFPAAHLERAYAAKAATWELLSSGRASAMIPVADAAGAIVGLLYVEGPVEAISAPKVAATALAPGRRDDREGAQRFMSGLAYFMTGQTATARKEWTAAAKLGYPDAREGLRRLSGPDVK